jgi:hypothetical protein
VTQHDAARCADEAVHVVHSVVHPGHQVLGVDPGLTVVTTPHCEQPVDTGAN